MKRLSQPEEQDYPQLCDNRVCYTMKELPLRM
jgi:hypothetical protein